MDRPWTAVDGAGRVPGLRTALWLLLLMAVATAPSLAAAQDLTKFAKGRQLMMVRHAYAPGNGDPAGFRIGDCNTQRNLNHEGRAQAERLGAYIRAQGIEHVRVLTSQWCRCRETAEFLDFGEPEEFTGQNSFYTVPEKEEAWLAKLRARIGLVGRRTDEPVIMVTHAVTISAISGTSAGSGDGILLDLNGTGSPDFAERVCPSSGFLAPKAA